MATLNAVNDEKQNQRQCPSGTNDCSDRNGDVPIRTVYVCGIEANQIDKIHKYFGQFGEIESVSMRFESTRTRWCLVQFEQQEDAEEVLLRAQNKWNRYDVRAADPWHQPDHPLQVAPEQDSYSNISVALNDDCLQAVFKRLKLSSLTQVAGVCKKFNQHAKKTFALKHKHLDSTEQFDGQHDLFNSAMEHFGKSVQSLGIDADLFSKEGDAYRMVGQNCGQKLKQLELRNFQFCGDLLLLCPIFSQIEQLKLYMCTDSIGLRELMACCGELKSLSLSSSFDQHTLSRTFPKLQELSFHRNGLSDDTFKSFITRHPKLIKLSIECMQFTPRVLQTIGEHAKKLRELKFVQVEVDHFQFQINAAYIGQLSSLKKLQLDIEYSIVPVLRALVANEVPIEMLGIQFYLQSNVDQAIKCIAQLKRIKILQLTTNSRTYRVTDKDAVGLAEGLPELEELHLAEIHGYNKSHSNYEFKSQLSIIGLRKTLVHANKLKSLKLHSIDSINVDIDDYMAMLDAVQKRNGMVSLVIEIHSKRNHVNVPAAVLAENRNTFNIKEARFDLQF